LIAFGTQEASKFGIMEEYISQGQIIIISEYSKASFALGFILTLGCK